MSDLAAIKERYLSYKSKGLNLNMKRGQPSDENFDLSNAMLTIIDENDVVTPSGLDIRNYPGGVAGLPEARELFASVLGVQASEMIVGNSASLKLMSNTVMWAMLKGMQHSTVAWGKEPIKMLVTVPGYDRHFTLLAGMGIELVSIQMTADGPDIDAIEALAAADASIKGLAFVPTYNNPTGDSISDETVRRLASMPTAAPDFTIFADDAYIVHHLGEDQDKPLNLLNTCREEGNPDRVYLFGSTSKVTFASAGIGFMASSEANVAYISKLMGLQFIGPNKVEQYRHVKFLTQYEGGVAGLMADHAKILKPKFDAVQTVLEEELGGTGLATWTNPNGGYFVSLDTVRPVADRVVALAADAGVALTPAGATYPLRQDPNNANIRLAPTRPPLVEVEEAMRVVAVCVLLASAEYDAQ